MPISSSVSTGATASSPPSAMRAAALCTAMMGRAMRRAIRKTPAARRAHEEEADGQETGAPSRPGGEGFRRGHLDEERELEALDPTVGSDDARAPVVGVLRPPVGAIGRGIDAGGMQPSGEIRRAEAPRVHQHVETVDEIGFGVLAETRALRDQRSMLARLRWISSTPRGAPDSSVRGVEIARVGRSVSGDGCTLWTKSLREPSMKELFITLYCPKLWPFVE